VRSVLILRLKKEMQLEDGAFDPNSDLVSGATTPGDDEQMSGSDNSLAEDLIAELEELELDVGSAVK